MTAENIDDLKMVTVRFYHGYTLKNPQFRALRKEEQRTITILPISHDLFNKMDMQNMNRTMLGYQSELSG